MKRGGPNFNKGIALAKALVIIAVVTIAAGVFSYYLSLTKNISSVKDTVYDVKYVSYSAKYNSNVDLDFGGGVKATVSWDGKAVGAQAVIGKAYEIQGVETYFIQIPQIRFATKGSSPLIHGNCYRATINDPYIPPAKYLGKDTKKLEFTIEQWNSLDIGIRNRWISIGTVVESGNKVTVEVLVKGYNVYNYADVEFEHGYKTFLVCTDWHIDYVRSLWSDTYPSVLP